VEAFRGITMEKGALDSFKAMYVMGRQVVSTERSQAVGCCSRIGVGALKEVARMTRRGPCHWLAHGGFCKACSSLEMYW